MDLVETGTTMRAAGLEIVAEVISTEAVLIANRHTKYGDLISVIKRRIQVREAANLQGVQTAEKFLLIEYNIKKSQLEEACAITPGQVL